MRVASLFTGIAYEAPAFQALQALWGRQGANIVFERTVMEIVYLYTFQRVSVIHTFLTIGQSSQAWSCEAKSAYAFVPSHASQASQASQVSQAS